MKIWCDVCSSKEASVFCSADEASLCLDCDPKVHQANKLASKHQRFSLLKPTSSDFPVCDICQEKKALLFCQQDRAIFCRDCDISIHAANEHTQKHNRYLLTGIKLSPPSTSNLPQTLATASTCTNTNQMSKDGSGGSSSNNSSGFDQVPDFKSEKSNSTKKIVPSYSSSANYSEISSTLTNEINNKSLRPAPNVMSTTASKDGSITQLISSSGGGGNISDGSTTSSISEYLMEMLPGWQVEDLLQDSSSIPFTYSKMQDNNFLGIDLLPNKDDERDRSFENNMGVWVPQAPSPLLPLQPSTPFSTNIAFGMNHGLIQNHHQTAKGENNKKPSSRKKMTVNNNAHDGFMVPQISPQFFSGSNKRYRPFY